MKLLAALVLLCLTLPALLSCAYLFLMTLFSGRLKAPIASSRALRFDVIVPAHNELAIIERAIASLRGVNWPPEQFRIIVVADNCTDETARVAEAAGAEVLIRNDLERRGKGYALQHAFNASRARKWADALVVIDADAEVSSNLLDAFAARLEAGAQAVQAHYGVLNPMASWRTRLISIAHGAFHTVRSRTRERLGLSCGIRGNGWCITQRLLEQVPFQAFSLTEDVEYGIAIGLAGHRVEFADEAHADADMVSSGDIARQQRQRWETGRFQLIRSKALALLLAASKRHSAVCLDLALDLLVLPLSYVAVNVLALTVLAGAAYALQVASPIWLWIALGCCTSLIIYVFRGWQLSGTGAQGLLDLARVPWFLVWRLSLALRRDETRDWVRTARERNPARRLK